MKRIKESELVNSVPEELWTRSIILYRWQQIKPSLKKRKKVKWISEEDLQIAKERIEAKCKGERERYIQLNRDQRERKVFFNEQCIKLGGGGTEGETRDHFRKIGAIKGIFCPKMDTRKDTNVRNLVDAEEIKEKWKEYMEELYKKKKENPDEPDNYFGVVTQTQ